MKRYGQFCPVAQTTEILGERWTFLVVRDLMLGSTRFNDLRRGVPLMSPALLSKRLATLEEAGVVERRPSDDGHGTEYHLTEAGRALEPVIKAMGVWGTRWLRREPTPEQLDPAHLMWEIQFSINPSAFPQRRVVVQFRFTDAPRKKSVFWIVTDHSEVELCIKDPGFDVDVTVESEVKPLLMSWFGYRDLRQHIRAGAINVEGPGELVERLPNWLGNATFAEVARETVQAEA